MIFVVSDAAQHAMGLAWSNRRPGGLTGGNAARRVTPTLEALPLRTGAVPAALLASGSWSAVVLSEHGNRLETLQFPVSACNGTNSKHGASTQVIRALSSTCSLRETLQF